MTDLSGIEKVGIAGIAVAILWFGLQVLKLFAEQWKNSNESQDRGTEALNRNTASFERLTSVFEKASERDVEFQRNMIQMMTTAASIQESTHRKVSEIHGTLILRRRVQDEEQVPPSGEGS